MANVSIYHDGSAVTIQLCVLAVPGGLSLFQFNSKKFSLFQLPLWVNRKFIKYFIFLIKTLMNTQQNIEQKTERAKIHTPSRVILCQN